MRAFRSGFTGAVYGGALCHAVRRVLDSSDDEMLSVTIRGILRRHGPLPLPRVSALLSDEAVEVLGRVPGGLSRYMQDRAWRFRVEALPNGMRVALLSADIQRAGDGARIVSQALAHAAVAPQQRISVAQLFRDLPAATQRQCGSAAHLEAFLLRHPGAVRVSAGIVCGPPAHSSSPRAAAQTANKNSALSASAAVPAGRGFEAAPGNFSPPPPPTPTTAGAAEDPRTLKLLALLHAAVPCSCYVPLRAVLRHPRRRICIEVDAPLSDILDALQRIPSSVLDCRVMGDTEDDVFLRMLDAERRAFLANEGVNADSYDVLAFGNPLHDAFMAFAARGPDEAQRVRGGIAMSELSEILPEDLLQRMRALYGAARGDPACIFIFDRLRHLFDVNLSQYRARPWAALSAREQPSSLTWLTTPTPVVLRNALAALEARPLSPAALHAALAERSQRQMAAAYGGAAAFVARHSLFLVAQDGLVLTPLHAARTHGARLGPGPGNGGPGGPGGPGGGGGGPGGGPGGFGGGAGGGAAGPLSEGQRARMLCDALPQGHAVEWQRFRIHPALRELPFDARRLRPDFFERHRNLFTSYEVLGTTTFIVGRRDGTPPDPHLLHAPCHTLADLVRLIALFSIDGAQEGTITNYLSKDARLVMRRYGTIEHIARQLPMWFDVRNDRQEAGCAFISYIGTSAQPTDVNTERDK